MKKIKEYLKMADVFPDNFKIDEIMVYNRKSRKFNNDTLEEYGLHAINSHDELVNQRNELLEVLEAFSKYIHAEQCSTDGPVHYSNGQLTTLAVMARKVIAKAKGGAA